MPSVDGGNSRGEWVPLTHNGAKQGKENPRFPSEKRWCGDKYCGAMTSRHWPYDVSSNKLWYSKVSVLTERGSPRRQLAAQPLRNSSKMHRSTSSAHPTTA